MMKKGLVTTLAIMTFLSLIVHAEAQQKTRHNIHEDNRSIASITEPNDSITINVVDPTPVPETEHQEVIRVFSRMGCSGVLIAADVVVTAGHCVCTTDRVGGNICNTRATVQFGPDDQIDGDVEVHAGYDPTFFFGIDHDIALIYLDQPSSVTPVDVATRSLRPGSDAKIVGFGATGNNCMNPEGTKNSQLVEIRNYKDSDKKLIMKGTVTCNGDSGGGIYNRRGTRLYGIHSGTLEPVFSENEPTAMNLPKYHSWLKARVCKADMWHACDGSAPMCRCGHKKADCDSDADCKWPFKCRHDVGDYYGYPARADVCLLPSESLPGVCETEDCNK